MNKIHILNQQLHEIIWGNSQCIINNQIKNQLKCIVDNQIKNQLENILCYQIETKIRDHVWTNIIKISNSMNIREKT